MAKVNYKVLNILLNNNQILSLKTASTKKNSNYQNMNNIKNS